MVDMRKKRTLTLRADPDFKKWIDDLSRKKSFQEKDKITTSRITEATYKQYAKYPELIEEINRSKLGKWKSR